MGLNAGCIFIRATANTTVARVAEQVADYWQARGAAVEATTHVDLPRDALCDGRLAYAIRRIDAQWIALSDSERHPHEGAALAEFLAEALKTQVSTLDVYDICDPPEPPVEAHYGTSAPEPTPGEGQLRTYRDLDPAATPQGNGESIRFLGLAGLPLPWPPRPPLSATDDDIGF